jgi:hypothetical protein
MASRRWGDEGDLARDFITQGRFFFPRSAANHIYLTYVALLILSRPASGPLYAPLLAFSCRANDLS